jgi:superoxide dismutase, Cu-Zn family
MKDSRMSNTQVRQRWIAACLFAAAALSPRGADAHDATVDLMNSRGEVTGHATFTQRPGGVHIRVEATGLAPGAHGIHIHAVGTCEPPSFDSAGPHLNPDGKHHGLDNPSGPHAGDLPNLIVGADGTAHASFLDRHVTLGTGRHSLFPAGGTSLVIHADPDDERSDPAGNAGPRIACGIIVR